MPPLLDEFGRCSSFVSNAPPHSPGGTTLEPQKPKHFGLAFAAVLTCGTINNFAYCMLSGASQDLCRQWHTESMTTMLTMIANFSALSATVISMRFLSRLRFYTRIRIVLLMSLLAYAGVAYSALPGVPGGGFWMAGAMSFLCGWAQIFGEVTNLAFLKTFSPELVGAWGAGTGLAGIFGSLMYICLRGMADLSSTAVFLLATPLLLLYGAAFHYLHGEAIRGLDGYQLARALGGVGAPRRRNGADPREPLHPDVVSHAPPTCASIKAAIRASGNILFNMVAVYCLEYFVYPGLDDRETLCARKSWYTAMWMCYNVGVTISRLSVSFYRFKRVWILTVIQFINVLGWTLEVYTGAVRDSFTHERGYYIMIVWMVLVGLCGGATYSNCMYLFNTQAEIPDNLRELGINLGFFMSNVGITLATFSFIWLDKSILDSSVLYPGGCTEVHRTV